MGYGQLGLGQRELLLRRPGLEPRRRRRRDHLRSQHADTLGFRDAAASTYNISSAQVHGYIYAGGDNDVVRGSNTTHSGYGESLYGEADDDTVSGADGNDYVDGGDGNDVCYGRDGDDTVNGGPGQDHEEGGAGDDILNGGADFDVVCDVGGGVDEFHDGDDVSNSDKLWDSDAADDAYCGTMSGGSYNTQIRSGMNDVWGSCTGAVLTTKPIGCP